MLCTEGHGISELLYGSYVIKRKRLFVQKNKKTTKSKKLIYFPLYKEKKKSVWSFFAPTYYMAIEEAIHV